jgi:cardiolipin-specific phospholipase
MAVCYALKYPGHLNKLILASPVGIPEDPFATQAAMPEPSDSTLESEFTQDAQTETTSDGNNFLNQQSKRNARSASPASSASSSPRPAPSAAPTGQPHVDNPGPDGKPQPRRMPKWLTYLWDANISPFSFVRWSGPLGPRLVSGWTSRRFSHLPQEEATALHDYAYSLFRLRGSGEYALAYILAPGAFARSPLIRRVGGIGRQRLENGTLESGVPVVLMYGENDWMDVKGGYAAKKLIDAEREKALQGKTAEEREQDEGGAKVVIIKKAGHHVYLDSPNHFNDVMMREMEDVEQRTKGLKRGTASGWEVIDPEKEEVQHDIRY